MSKHYTVSTSQGDGPARLVVRSATKLGEAILEAMFAPEHGAGREMRAAWKEGRLMVWVEDGGGEDGEEES